MNFQKIVIPKANKCFWSNLVTWMLPYGKTREGEMVFKGLQVYKDTNSYLRLYLVNLGEK